MVHSAKDLDAIRTEFGGHIILKANTQGYDGKGQWAITPSTDVNSLWKNANIQTGIAEQKIDFAFELSVIGGRHPNGRVQLYRPFLNHHANHILDVAVLGSPLITAKITEQASEMARTVLEHFHVIGVLCLELFLTGDGKLLVNEIAPRPHNSGHLTIEAYNCSQFELQLRTICGLPDVPLVPRTPAAAMANLLGQHLPETWNSDNMIGFAEPESHLHQYGKYSRDTNRKVGHITSTDQDADTAETQVRRIRKKLRNGSREDR
jgi:5-(carboxyamino)imidazole ribonucleotide synthase